MGKKTATFWIRHPVPKKTNNNNNDFSIQTFGIKRGERSEGADAALVPSNGARERVLERKKCEKCQRFFSVPCQAGYGTESQSESTLLRRRRESTGGANSIRVKTLSARPLRLTLVFSLNCATLCPFLMTTYKFPHQPVY